MKNFDSKALTDINDEARRSGITQEESFDEPTFAQVQSVAPMPHNILIRHVLKKIFASSFGRCHTITSNFIKMMTAGLY